MPQPAQQPTVFAGVGNRAVAIAVDVVLVLLVGGLVSGAAPYAPVVSLLVGLVYFWGMPLTPLQGTLGKSLTRIKLCDRAGRRLTWRAAGIRAGATWGWLGGGVAFGGYDVLGPLQHEMLSFFWLTFLLPWAPLGFMPRRESLFDLIAGSLAVTCRSDAESIARAAPVQKPGILRAIALVLGSMFTGLVIGVPISTQRDMDRRARVAYALMQTGELREKVGAFFAEQRRWPTAPELDVPEWTPYPAGGGYRLGADGSVVITFAVLPDLKGRSVTLHPALDDKGKIRWDCSRDEGFPRRVLPASCRDRVTK